jgi:amino acid transporter
LCCCLGLHAPGTCCSALQVRNPSKVLPIGILGALSIVTSCYLLMSAGRVAQRDWKCSWKCSGSSPFIMKRIILLAG